MKTTTLFSFLSPLAYLSKGFMESFYAETLSKNFDCFLVGQKKGQDDLHDCVNLYTSSQSCKGIAGTVRLNAQTYMYKEYRNYKKRKKRFKRKRVPFSSSLATLLDNWSTVTFKLLQGKGNNWPQQTQTSATMHSWSVSEMFVAYALCICQKYLLSHCIFLQGSKTSVWRKGRKIAWLNYRLTSLLVSYLMGDCIR